MFIFLNYGIISSFSSQIKMCYGNRLASSGRMFQRIAEVLRRVMHSTNNIVSGTIYGDDKLTTHLDEHKAFKRIGRVKRDARGIDRKILGIC